MTKVSETMTTPTKTAERSAELLRLALPLISKHGDGFQPASYAVWYEYVHGANEALKNELEGTIKTGARLTEKVTFDLYQRHIIDRAEQAVSSARSGLLEVLEHVNLKVDAASSDTIDFTTSIDAFGHSLEESDNAESLRLRVSSIVDQAQRMSGSMSALQKEFEASRTELERLADELTRARQEVLTDPLTGLTNRRGFDMAVSEAIVDATAQRAEIALMMIDIDHFKRINDSYGHLFGDQVIRGVAHAIKACVKGKDIASRYGGEEFVVVLPATGLRGGKAVAEQIRVAVERSRIRKANSQEAVGNITVSIGVAVRSPTEPIEQLIERADKAMYESKSGGRNLVTAAT
jgi:diguanylate cyclase